MACGFNISNCRLCGSRRSLMDIDAVLDKTTRLDEVLNYIILEIDWSSKNLPSKVCSCCRAKILMFMEFKVKCIRFNILRNIYMKEHGESNNQKNSDRSNCELNNTLKEEEIDIEQSNLAVNFNGDKPRSDNVIENTVEFVSSESNSRSECYVNLTDHTYVKREPVEVNVEENTVASLENINNKTNESTTEENTASVSDNISSKTHEAAIENSKEKHIKNISRSLGQETQEVSEEFHCFECDNSFNNITHFQTHYAQAHKTSKGYMSNSLMERLILRRKVGLPQKKPKRKKLYICGDCDKVFRDSRGLKRHKNNHKDKRDMICEFCGKAFFRIEILKKHVKTHQNIVYKCNECNKQFRSDSGLLHHKKVNHSSNVRKKHSCHICEFQTFYVTRLNYHIRRHNKDYKFSCEICSKKFITGVELRKHILFHRGFPKVPCKYCDKMYRDLKKHQERKHAGELANEGTKTELKQTEEIN